MIRIAVRFAAAVGVAASLLATPAVRGDDRNVEAAHRAAIAQLVPRVVELAKWCDAKKLYLERDQLAQVVLVHDPDHADARRWLRFEKRSGQWKRTKPYKAPRNWEPDALAQVPARRDALFGAFADRMFEVLATDDTSTSPGVRDRVVRSVLSVAPDDARFRMVNGDVRRGDEWVLAETQRTPEGRSTLRAAAARALGGVPAPTPSRVSSVERSLGLQWTAAVATPGVRVLATTSPAEAAASAALCEAADDLVGEVLAMQLAIPNGLGFYVLRDRREARTFVGRHPSMDEASRRDLDRFSGLWIPKSLQALEYSDHPAMRIDGTVRQTVNLLLRRALGGDLRAWVSEGTGIYLSHLLTGTRLTYFAKASRYAQDSEAGERSLSGAADWLVEARRMLDEDPLDLDLLLHRDLNVMTGLDSLYAHALSAYLLETRPKEARQFLLRLGEGMKVAEAIALTLDTDVHGLQYRLERWLRETN